MADGSFVRSEHPPVEFSPIRLLTSGGLTVLLAASLALPVRGAAMAVEPVPSTIVQARAPSSVVTFRDGLVSIQADGETVTEILANVERKTGITLHVRAALPEDPVTLSLRDVPVEEALRRLLGPEANLLLVFDGSGGSGHSVAEVWILRRGRGVTATPVAANPPTGPIARPDTATPGATSPEDARQARVQAIGALGDSNDVEQALPLLVAASRDEDPIIRKAAAEALGELDTDDAIAPLGELLLNDPDWEVREAAAEAFEELESPQSVGVLRAALLDADEDVRLAVVDALGAIGGPEAIALLRTALRDEDEDVRDSAAEALALLRRTHSQSGL
jgi:hypothetical protein